MKSTGSGEPVDLLDPTLTNQTWLGLFRSTGELVKRIICDKDICDYHEHIDLKNLPSGRYYVIIQSSRSIQTDRFEIP